jgi:1,4-alpha-glucan branching enzyme
MFSKGQKPGSVRFKITPASNARKVMIAGDFSQWKPVTMKKQKDGSFVATVDLRPGAYEYKFIVDDQWVVDPDNNAWALNPYGTVNSVAIVD